MCPSTDQATCSGANNWQTGWIVFFDKSGNGIFDASVDTILRVRAAATGGITIVAAPGPTSPATSEVIFNREGFTTNMGTTQVALTLHTSDNFANSTRCVLVNFGGNLSTVTKGSTMLSEPTSLRAQRGRLHARLNCWSRCLIVTVGWLLGLAKAAGDAVSNTSVARTRALMTFQGRIGWPA